MRPGAAHAFHFGADDVPGDAQVLFYLWLDLTRSAEALDQDMTRCAIGQARGEIRGLPGCGYKLWQ